MLPVRRASSRTTRGPIAPITAFALASALASLACLTPACGQTQDFSANDLPPAPAPAPDAPIGSTPLPPPAPTSPSAPPEWTWLNPSPRGDDVLAIGGLADDDLWFVGRSGSVLRWNGKTVSSAYKGPPDVDYYAIAVSAPDDVWIAGRGTKGPAALHWNGVAWSTAYSLADSEIHQLWSLGRNDVWAATSWAMRHWDGATWTSSSITGIPAGTSWVARDLWGASSNDVWAVGDDGLIAHWDGATWSKQPAATGPSYSAGIDYVGIWGSGPKDIWAAYVPAKRATTVGFSHWDGETWSTPGFQTTYGAGIEGVGTGGIPFGRGKRVWGTSRNHVVAAPSPLQMWTYDGTSWKVLRLGSERRLYSPALGGVKDVYVTGGALDVRRFDPTIQPSSVAQLVPVFPAMRDSLSSVAAAPDGAVFTTGSKIYRWNGGSWQALPDGIDIGASALSAVSASDLWVAGARSSTDYDAPGGPVSHRFSGIRRYENGAWSTPVPDEEPAATPQVNALVFAASSNDVWVSQTASEVKHFDGATWTRFPVDVGDGQLQRIGGTPGNVWFVSSTTTATSASATTYSSIWRVHRWDGKTIREVHRGTYPYPPQSIWAHGPNEVWIAGQPGIRFDGTRWSPLPLGTDKIVSSVWGADPTHVWFLTDGAVVSWDGVTAREEVGSRLPALRSLRGVAASPAAGIWTVGDDGMTLRLLPTFPSPQR